MIGNIANLPDGTVGAIVQLNTALQSGITPSRARALGTSQTAMDALAPGGGQIVAAGVHDRIWVLKQGASSVSVRNAQSGEMVQKVDILDEALTLAAVPFVEPNTGALSYQVWVSSLNGKMHIFNEEGSMLGLLQASGTPVATRLYPMPVAAGNILFSSGNGKDVALWDSKQYSVLRSFFGRTPGELVTGVCAADPECSIFAVSTTASIRLWSRAHGTAVHDREGGANAIYVDYNITQRPYSEQQNMMTSNSKVTAPTGASVEGTLVGYLWAAQRSLLTVFAIVVTAAAGTQSRRSTGVITTSQVPAMTLVQERVLPCPGATQLLRTTPLHITAVDRQGMVSVWSTQSFAPLRTFQTDNMFRATTPNHAPPGSAMNALQQNLQREKEKDKERDAESNSKSIVGTGPAPFLMVPTVSKATRLLWTFGPEDKALMWSDEAVLESGQLDASGGIVLLGNAYGGASSVSASGAPNAKSAISAVGASNGPVAVSKDMEREEITFLRRKLKYLETMATLYRQKIGVLFREKGGAAANRTQPNGPGGASQLISTFNEIDSAYADALARYDQQTLEQEPLPGYLSPTDGYGACVVGHPPGPGQTAEEYIDYWKRKYHEARSDMEKLKEDYESMMELFFASGVGKGEDVKRIGSSPHQQQQLTTVTSPSGRQLSLPPQGFPSSEADVRRAHHVCQLIREKNAVKERERQLMEDIAKLRAKLREFNTPLASRGPLEDAESLKVQNTALRDEVKTLRTSLDKALADAQQLRSQAKAGQLLKGRLAKMQAAVDEAEVRFSNRTAEMQGDIDSVLEKLYASQKINEEQRMAVRTSQTMQKEAELQALRHQQEIEKLQQQNAELEKRMKRQEEADNGVIDQLRDEIRNVCEALDDRDRKILDWQNRFEDQVTKIRDMEMEVSSLKYLLESKETELAVLMERVAHLESVISERRQYAQTIAEIQGRMEGIVEELRHSFTPGEFADSMAKLEDRMSNLLAVEQQLRHKDDIIAMRDDELQLLRENAAALTKEVTQISSVFLQLPKSVEEVEGLMIEVDEYRRRAGMTEEMQQRVRQRLLELISKRKSGAEIWLPDMDLLGGGAGKPLTTAAGGIGVPTNVKGKTPDAEALERAQMLADTLRGVASGAMKENKKGLMGGKPAIPYALHPIHQNRSLPLVEKEKGVEKEKTQKAERVPSAPEKHVDPTTPSSSPATPLSPRSSKQQQQQPVTTDDGDAWESHDGN